jgi:hypothetical protein
MIFTDQNRHAVAKLVRFGSNCEFLGMQYWRSWFRAMVSKDEMCQKLFSRILHANDGSEHSLRAFELALAIAKQSRSEIHMVSVKDVDYMPEFIEDVRHQQGRAARRMHAVLRRARAIAAKENQTLHCHLLFGHPVQAIVSLAISKSNCSSSEQEGTPRFMSVWSAARRIASCNLLPVQY